MSHLGFNPKDFIHDDSSIFFLPAVILQQQFSGDISFVVFVSFVEDNFLDKKKHQRSCDTHVF